jgi:ribosome biogenesis GTPase / thiamine phosphate phosphatase
VPVPLDHTPPNLGPLRELGWDAGWAQTATRLAGEQAAARPGRVARVDRGHALVRTADGLVRAAVAGLELTTGDWVLLDEGAGLGAALPRRTALRRGVGRGESRAQVLAANVDLVLIVVALSSAPNLSRLDRLLTVGWDSGAQPLVVLTKADLSATAETDFAGVAEAAPAVPVILTSAVDGRGLDDLRAQLAPSRTVALLGVSGAGKSSLVNALARADLLPTGPLRADGKGRHTTVSRELVVLPGMGVLLDTPGLRGIQLWDAGVGLERTFADIDELAAQCRFANCRHNGEPGCAVATAIAAGALSARRLASYQKLQREVSWLQTRYDARLRAEQRRLWRNRSKAMRQHPRWPGRR